MITTTVDCKNVEIKDKQTVTGGDIDQSSNLGHIGLGLDPVIDWLTAYINLDISTNDSDRGEHSKTMRLDQKDRIIL